MRAKSFGKIAVPTPGTLVRLTTDTTLRVARLRFAVVIGETAARVNNFETPGMGIY